MWLLLVRATRFNGEAAGWQMCRRALGIKRWPPGAVSLWPEGGLSWKWNEFFFHTVHTWASAADIHCGIFDVDPCDMTWSLQSARGRWRSRLVSSLRRKLSAGEAFFATVAAQRCLDLSRNSSRDLFFPSLLQNGWETLYQKRSLPKQHLCFQQVLLCWPSLLQSERLDSFLYCLHLPPSPHWKHLIKSLLFCLSTAFRWTLMLLGPLSFLFFSPSSTGFFSRPAVEISAVSHCKLGEKSPSCRSPLPPPISAVLLIPFYL